MSAEIVNLLVLGGGLVFGWIARHRGILAPPVAPGTPATPLVIPGPVVVPAIKTGNPLLDSILPMVLPFLAPLLQQEIQAKVQEWWNTPGNVPAPAAVAPGTPPTKP